MTSATPCADCGATDQPLQQKNTGLFCPPCHARYALEEQASDDLELGIIALLKQHAERWQQGRPLRELLGDEGQHVNHIFEYAVAGLLAAEEKTA